MPEKFFFILVVECSSNLVKYIARGKDPDVVVKRRDELRIQFPEPVCDVIVGGMITDLQKLQIAFPEFHGWEAVAQEELS